MSRTVVHIDRLVLSGIDETDREVLANSLRDELQRLLATPEFQAANFVSSQVSHLRTNPTFATGERSPAQVGSDAAQSVARVIQSWTR